MNCILYLGCLDCNFIVEKYKCYLKIRNGVVRNNYADRLCIIRVDLRIAYKISDGNPDEKKHFVVLGHRRGGGVK
jgi:hypothetical protein